MANENDDRLTGIASYILIDGVSIYITSYVVSMERIMTPRMNSSHYNARAGQFGTSQRAVAVVTTAAVEGRYRLQSVPKEIVRRLYSDEEAAPVVFGLDAGNRVGYGSFDIRNFQVITIYDDVVNFQCQLICNGPFYAPNQGD